MNYNCERCDKFLYTENVTFPCGFRAQLCNGCMNEIEAAARTASFNFKHEMMQATSNWLVGRATAGDAPSLGEWQSYAKAKEELDDIAFKFLAALVATKPKTTGVAP